LSRLLYYKFRLEAVTTVPGRLHTLATLFISAHLGNRPLESYKQQTNFITYLYAFSFDYNDW